jgi:hypothetical protein
MSEPSKLGVTQTGIGLTLLTCLLAALGYFALQRLGDSSDSPPVADSPTTPNETYQSSGTGSPNANAGQQNLPADGSGSPAISYPQTTLRPIWVAPQQDTDDTRLHRFDPNAPVEDVEGPSLFDSQPIELPQSTDEPTRY